MKWRPPGSSVHRILCKNTGVGCHYLLQGIFPTQGSNPRLLHWQVDSLPLSHQGSPYYLLAVVFFFFFLKSNSVAYTLHHKLHTARVRDGCKTDLTFSSMGKQAHSRCRWTPLCVELFINTHLWVKHSRGASFPKSHFYVEVKFSKHKLLLLWASKCFSHRELCCFCFYQMHIFFQ